MRIRQINLARNGEPEKVTAELTLDEALYITTMIGRQNGIQANEIMPDGETIQHELYEALTGELFNRYWHDGAAEARADRTTRREASE